MDNLKERLIDIMKTPNYAPLDVDKLYELLELNSADDFRNLAIALNELEDEFVIMHNKKGCFALLETFKLVKGILDVKEAGYGFVDLVDSSVFIRKDNLKGAITLDEVLVSTKYDSQGRVEGVVERIIKRGTTEVIGKLTKFKNKYVLRSVAKNIDLWVFIKSNDLKKAKPDDFVRVKITKYYPNNTADGKVEEILGNVNTPNIDITALINNANIPVAFSDETRVEVKKIPQSVNKNDYPDRVDLTNELIITIDGDDAKDLDDAVRCEKREDGTYLLGVYIAGVSSYVKEGSALDQDAYKRGTSVYLPDRVIPMLPKELSNGICSLNEGVDRLVMACEMIINQKGEVLEYNIFEAIINSTFRMTYNNVNKILNNDQILIKKYEKIVNMLYHMNELSKILYKMRERRGAFNFETNESKVVLDSMGKVLDIKPRTRGEGEKLIEEFMLIANETVATSMTWLDVPFIYRIHEEPKEDKIGRFIQILKNFNYPFKIKNKKAMSKALQEVLITLENDEKEDEIKKTIINNTLLRTMMKAKYSEHNLGHYGLASECYTHFTSPIRRYPDLLVHRLIKHYMLNDSQVDSTNSNEFFESKVYYTSNDASKKERAAEALERDATDLKKCEYMEQFIHNKFTGIISSITNWGIYVTLDNTIEGLIRYEDMHDDYYDIDEINARVVGRKAGNIYQMGDLVMVQVIDVNKPKRQITFKLIKKIENKN